MITVLHNYTKYRFICLKQVEALQTRKGYKSCIINEEKENNWGDGAQAINLHEEWLYQHISSRTVRTKKSQKTTVNFSAICLLACNSSDPVQWI